MNNSTTKALLLILLLTVCYYKLPAQELSQMSIVGKAEFLPNELIARTDENRDKNGDLAAGLLVVSDLRGLNYDSNDGIIRRVNRGSGEDLLYLSPKERVVTIYSEGFEPLRFVLNDIGIKLESGRVWQIKITGDRKTDHIPINIVRDQEDSDVYIDDNYVGKGTTHRVSLGEHSIRIEKPGFRIIKDTITVTETKTLFNYRMVLLEPQRITIRSVPAGATIFLDNVDEGITDKQLFKLPGKYSIKLSKSGFSDISEEIEVKEDAANVFTFNLSSRSVTLTLNISPSDAVITLNRVDYTNRKIIDISPGTYRIDISKEGYNEINDVIILELGKPITKDYTLIQKTGSLQLTIQPIDANVKLIKDGVTIKNWTGSESLRNLAIGSYRLEAESTGYERKFADILIKEDQTEKIDLFLEKLTKELTESKGIPWYYYVGGALVSAGTAAILLLTKSKEDPKTPAAIAEPPDRP